MGYLLPVSNFQYNDYHNRLNRTKRNPYPIKQVYHSQLSLFYGREERLRDLVYDSKKTKRVNDNSTNYHKMSNKMIAEMTGKGRQLDISV